jgi:tetratricopeptide (TPR) repeat protein
MTRTGKAADGLARRGEAYQFLGKARKALADYTEALRLDPRHVTARLRRAQLNTARGRHREALRDATRLAKRDRHSAWAWYWRAVALTELGQLERAEKSLRRALRASAAGEPRFFVLQGDLAARQGHPSAAIVAYARAIELDPSDPVALRRRAAVLLRIDQPLGAISDLTRSLEFDPHDAETLIQRGNAFLRTGDGRAADADFQTALGLDATRVKAFCGHGLCLALQGQHEAGLIWLTKSIARFGQNRDLAELLMARGKIFFQMGRFPPAITDFTAVMDLRRDDAKAVAVARCARAVAFVQQGELVQAQREFDKVLAAIPDHAGARVARQWLADGQGPRPALLRPPDQVIRPTRPPISGAPLTTEQAAANNGRWDAPPPYDLWVVRNAAQREYGPVTKAVLDQWVREGRVDLHSRVLRAGWPKWRRAPAVYAELAER